MDTNIDDWASSDFLLVKDVEDEDIIDVNQVIGLVESFGKQKVQLEINFNGKRKILNVNKVQFNQMKPISPGRKYAVKKIKINGGTALNFRPLI